jgi:hypothetical protein
MNISSKILAVGRKLFVHRDRTTPFASPISEKKLTNEYQEALRSYQNYVIELTAQFEKLPPEQWEQLETDLPFIEHVGNELVAQIKQGKVDEASLDLALRFALNTHQYLFMRREVGHKDWLQMGLKVSRGRDDRGKERMSIVWCK